MVFRSSRRSAQLNLDPSPKGNSERAPRVMVELEPLNEVPGGDERIVVVDDNTILRRTIQRVLLRLGYQIEGYASATQAIAAMSAAPREVALVFSDCDMPGLTGYQLAQRLLAGTARNSRFAFLGPLHGLNKAGGSASELATLPTETL
jgi:PleD family two-component response regulator